MPRGTNEPGSKAAATPEDVVDGEPLERDHAPGFTGIA